MEMNILRHTTTVTTNLSNFKSTLKKKYFSENGHFSQIFKEFVKSINILTIHGHQGPPSAMFTFFLGNM